MTLLYLSPQNTLLTWSGFFFRGLCGLGYQLVPGDRLYV